MGGRAAVSPGGALLRTSRMFSVPKPLPESHIGVQHIGDRRSDTMTKPHPQMQSITTPLTSRQNGDWGFKRPFPLKTTLNTSTPLIRVHNIDARENITDFASAADHSLSLEKFQELRIAMSVPRRGDEASAARAGAASQKSVFEESMDVTDFENGRADDRRWKFEGPWLARMTDGEFMRYVEKEVRPKRAQFRTLLREKLAADITARQNTIAMEEGKTAPPALTAGDITDTQFTEYMRALRNDRSVLYALVSKFLDLAPLGRPIGVVSLVNREAPVESPWGKAGPPSTHPSAGISYLRTKSYLENHPVYGPQARHAPTLARVVQPRTSFAAAKLGVAGFVADTPSGDNAFNVRHFKGNRNSSSVLSGIANLDTTTWGGAKAYVEPATANVDPSGKIIIELREADAEAQVIARENSGQGEVYNDKPMQRTLPKEEPKEEAREETREAASGADEIRAEELLGAVAEEITEKPL